MWRASLLLVLSLLLVACSSDKDAYVAKNEEILDALPVIPGATEYRTTSASYVEEESGPIVGYTTNVVYRVPEELSAQEAIDFYVDALTPEWAVEFDEIPITNTAGDGLGVVLLANFRRGEAGVQLNTDGIFPGGGPHTIELSIDHRRHR